MTIIWSCPAEYYTITGTYVISGIIVLKMLPG